ncbi:hypothetical protein QTP70_034956 [Hemibagrus guttatus]|uniref:Fascin n=1 Tax=Hemibagrus guttatus TaxID=175788 RepID=A0AAE0PZT9_9TELE|nr:hypothetical protein QTP70_034956 [Hemibagrus guttatus]
MASGGLGESTVIQLGLINAEDKYLTAEAFGFKVNACATSMRKKQVWTLEHADQAGGSSAVLLRSHLGRYLSSDKDGNVTAECERPRPDCRFCVVAHADGRWSLRSEAHGRYLGGTEDRVVCSTTDEQWYVHLATHPQVNLYSVARKRYLHAHPGRSELAATAGGRFLSSTGALVPEPQNDTGFTREFRAGTVAFRDAAGRYLAPSGPSGAVKAGKNVRVGKDEVFVLERTRGQVASICQLIRMKSQIRKFSRWRWTRRRSAVLSGPVMGNLEPDSERSDSVHRFGKVSPFIFVQDAPEQLLRERVFLAAVTSASCFFELEWNGAKVMLKASNGKYIAAKKNGQLAASVDSAGEQEEFVLKLINRPLIVVRGEDGFIGCRKQGTGTLDSNRSSYDIFQLEYNHNAYCLRDSAGKYWTVEADGVVVSSSATPVYFLFEFCDYNRVAIKTQQGLYLKGDHAGVLKANAKSIANATLWEY